MSRLERTSFDEITALDHAIYATGQGNSSLEDYMQFLDIEKFPPSGTILDLGSGGHARFARELLAEPAYRDAIVVSLNPRLIERKARVYANPTIATPGEEYDLRLYQMPDLPQYSGHSVAGLAQRLPFTDEAFDIITSFACVPTILPQNQADYKLSFEEIARVLKKGGIAYLGPMLDYQLEESLSLLSSIEGLGIRHSIIDKDGRFTRVDGDLYRLIIEKSKE